MKNDQVVEKLTETKFIGPFPGGVDVLLVPLSTAFEEVKHLDKELTEKKLKTLLKSKNIQVFSNVEEWVKFKTPLKK